MKKKFCRYCGHTFEDGRRQCGCGRETEVLPENYVPAGGVVLMISGRAAARVCDPPISDPPYTLAEMEADFRDDDIT